MYWPSPTIHGLAKPSASRANTESATGEERLSRSALDLRSVCRRHIEHLCAGLPAGMAWLRYCSGEPPHQRQTLSHAKPARSCFDPATLSYLESETWLTPDLPVRVLTRLEVPLRWKRENAGQERAAASLEAEIFAYAYRFSQGDGTGEYLLLATGEVLSAGQKQTIAQQAQLLQDYLSVASECARQREKIQLLEQAVRGGEHQLRHSLALISLYAENLYLGLPSGPFQEQASIVRQAANDLHAHLKDLLDCGQQTQLQMARHDLREIVTETLTVLQPKLEAKQVHVDYPQRSVFLTVDRWQIKQVLENLLSNAIAFSPVGETVTCHWRVFHHEVLVEIRDRGSGLSPDDLTQIFTPFYSRRQGGTGLGLTIAKKIILDHHGNIWGQNLPGGGAQFSFVLPRYGERSRASLSSIPQPSTCRYSP